MILRAAARFALMSLAIVMMASESAAEPAAQPVVVELFTSQGCSSCPPADALLSALDARGDVLALSFHVDYWNYIGWADPFSSAAATARQRAYAAALGLHVVYTPQMVVDGRLDVVGSDRGAVLGAIAEGAATPHLTPALEGDAADGWRVRLPATPLDAPATVWRVLYDASHETAVAQGENAGRVIRNSNVVRDIVALAQWNGEAAAIPLGLAQAANAGRDGCAIIVQQGETGPVLGAVMMALDR